MLSLIYVSTASPALERAKVEALAARAAAANAELRLTGLLVWNTRHFMQLLEGDSRTIHALMERIGSDTRHRDIAFLRHEERQSRECPDWYMQALETPLAGAGSASDFAARLPADMGADTRLLFTSFASALKPLPMA